MAEQPSGVSATSPSFVLSANLLRVPRCLQGNLPLSVVAGILTCAF